jgi:hypothetical protein
LNPRYWPGLEKERPAETEEGVEDAVVVAEEASLLSTLGMAALTPLIAPPDGGVGGIDVEAMAAAAPPTGEVLAPAAIEADEAGVPVPASGGGGGAAPPPAA